MIIFYLGCIFNMVRNGIVNVSEVVIYDIIKEMIIRKRFLEDGVFCYFASVIVVGFCGTVVLSFVDVVKIRYMNFFNFQYGNILQCIVLLWKKYGFFGFYKGQV